jgi:hypothetical protein
VLSERVWREGSYVVILGVKEENLLGIRVWDHTGIVLNGLDSSVFDEICYISRIGKATRYHD